MSAESAERWQYDLARVMGAGPELLDALQRVIGTVEHAYHTSPDPDGSLWDDVKACRAAIAKALGTDTPAQPPALAQRRVPDAVRKLPGKWRGLADDNRRYAEQDNELGRRNSAFMLHKGADALEARAAELESALVGTDQQQEARK